MEKTFDNTKDCPNEVETKENESLYYTPTTEPVAGPSGIVRLKLRKDLFEEPNVVDIVASKKIGNNPNTPNYNRSHPSNSSLIENDSKFILQCHCLKNLTLTFFGGQSCLALRFW